MLEPLPFLMATHDSLDWPEWGSAPRRPLVRFDMAHAGEWMASVIGDDPVTGMPRVYQVVRCELCIACHIWPLPPEADLAAYYARRFYDGPAAHEVAQHARDRAWYERCAYGPVFDQCEAFLRRTALKVLDIGAGNGVLLGTAQNRDYRTRGIEPDPRQCEALAARGHRMCIGALADHRRCVQKWQPDVVTLWETLEHVPCPEDLLLQVYDVLPIGGLLVVSVPNDLSPLQLQACAKYDLPYYWLISPVHLQYFTPKTIQLLVRRCGYKIRDLRGTYPLEQNMVRHFGQNYVGNSALWRAYTDEKIAIELDAVRTGHWLALEAEYRANIQERRGRSIIVIAEKV